MNRNKINQEIEQMASDMNKMILAQNSKDKRASAYTVSSLVRTTRMTQHTVQMICVRSSVENSDNSNFDVDFKIDNNKRANSPTPKCKGCNVM